MSVIQFFIALRTFFTPHIFVTIIEKTEVPGQQKNLPKQNVSSVSSV